MPSRKTNEEFLYDLRLITSTLLPIERYINATTKINILCLDCNNVFAATPDNLLRGRGCPDCSKKRRGTKRRKTHEQFLHEMKIIHPELIVNSLYTTSFDKVNCTCNVCQTNFNGIPANMLYGSGCPECGDKKIGEKLTKPFSKFKEELYAVNQDITVIGEYVKQSANIRVKCNICNHEWSPTGTSLLSGVGCPMCANSHGEKRIDRYLHELGINHEHQKEYENLYGSRGGHLSYDFYLQEYNLLIEYQGQYHDGTARNQTKEEFARQLVHDKLKREYASDNHIALVEIWYYEYQNIENVLNHYLN